MLPSSASGNDNGRRTSALRRWGPLAAVVVVAAVIATVVIVGGGDDKTQPESASTSSVGASPTGALSFSQAKADDRNDVSFPDGCDLETGRVAIPFFYAPECYANVDDNGGATARGVTADTITVVAYVPPDTDLVYDFITAAIANDDTAAQTAETTQGFVDLFQRYYQTYGRKVQLKILNGSGVSTDSVAARADAVKAVEEMGAFAVLGGPPLTDAWTEEMRARGVPCIGCTLVSDPKPSVFPIVASSEQTRLMFTEWASKKLKGKNAEFAGDPAFKNQPRKLGHIYIDTGGDEQANAADLKAKLTSEGLDIAVQLPYSLDPARLQEQATTVISQLKSAGVTSVIIQGDPVAPGTFTREATAQNYFPEWLLYGSALIDTTAFGRTFDQQQWAHAFGISSLGARVTPEISDGYNLYQWFKGTAPPADDTVGVIYPNPSLLFSGIQAAGPNLTPDTFREGLFSLPRQPSAITQPAVTYGDKGLWPGVDYNGIDNFTEIWWDPTVEGPDEIRKPGTGMYRYVDGGKRYYLGEWGTDLKVFDPAGTITIYDKRPESEQTKDYPPPR